MLLVGDGESSGIMDTEKARAIAQEQGLDLVEVSPLANPPVCKIMDFGVYIYSLKKKEQQQRKSSRKAETKTIRLSIRIDKHDIEVKVNKARKFLKDRHPLKVVVIFRGREITHANLGIDKLNLFQKLLEDVAVVEQAPKRQGYQAIMMLNPIK